MDFKFIAYSYSGCHRCSTTIYTFRQISCMFMFYMHSIRKSPLLWEFNLKYMARKLEKQNKFYLIRVYKIVVQNIYYKIQFKKALSYSISTTSI